MFFTNFEGDQAGTKMVILILESKTNLSLSVAVGYWVFFLETVQTTIEAGCELFCHCKLFDLISSASRSKAKARWVVDFISKGRTGLCTCICYLPHTHIHVSLIALI